MKFDMIPLFGIYFLKIKWHIILFFYLDVKIAYKTKNTMEIYIY